MAWLQNLAGRAEDLLNKIDQNAATVLNDSTTKIDVKDWDPSTFSIPVSDTTQDILINQTEMELNTSSAMKLSSPQNSPSRVVVEDVASQNEAPLYFNVVSDKKKSSLNGSVKEENGSVEKAPTKSDRCSSSSSLHTSFMLAEENQNLNEKIAKLEFENQNLNKQLLNIHHLYLQLRNENSNLQNQIERLNEQIVNAQNEKDQYMARAQRILQEKETLIHLKEENTTDDDNNIFSNYMEELKNELDFQQTKNQQLSDSNKKLTNDIQSLQMQHQIIQNNLQQMNQQLEENLLNERNLKRVAEEECQLKNKEIHLKLNEISQLQDIINTKTNDIKQLQMSLQQKPNDDLESRIKSLTQTLMIKQNTLETITTERNALRLQIEKQESEYQKKLLHLQRNQVKIVNIPDRNDSMASQVPQFMRVSPLDAGVTRRVKHAYSTVDSISIRTGIFLRRYPIARVIVFCYMVLLHIWVLVILFLYAPSNR